LEAEEEAVEGLIEERGEGRGRVCAWWMGCIACVLVLPVLVPGEDEADEEAMFLVLVSGYPSAILAALMCLSRSFSSAGVLPIVW
jgi:hypothetical protein